MNVELSDNEIKILAEIIKQSIDELRVEIRHTDDHEYKEELKHKEKLIEQLLEKIKTIS